jgi:hypothetical protein
MKGHRREIACTLGCTENTQSRRERQKDRNKKIAEMNGGDIAKKTCQRGKRNQSSTFFN